MENTKGLIKKIDLYLSLSEFNEFELFEETYSGMNIDYDYSTSEENLEDINHMELLSEFQYTQNFEFDRKDAIISLAKKALLNYYSKRSRHSIKAKTDIVNRKMNMAMSYFSGLSYEVIGENYGLCRERIRQIIDSTIKIIRSDSKELKHYL